MNRITGVPVDEQITLKGHGQAKHIGLDVGKPPQLQVGVEWFVRRDLAEAVEIEKLSRPLDAWTEEDFLIALRQRNCIGMCARETTGPGAWLVRGFMVYELHKSVLNLVRFCVDPNVRRLGIGRQMVERLRCKLSNSSREQIHVMVPELLLPAQLFFAAQGFRCVAVHRDVCEMGPGCCDGYEMQFHLPQSAAVR